MIPYGGAAKRFRRTRIFKIVQEEDLMEYVTLGKTGLRVSRMGLGGIPIQRVGAAEAKALIDALEANGVNFIDSARGYSVSEELLGQALEGRRDKFVLATKTMSRDKEGMAKDIETSLKNFRTDYIDLYQVHNPTPQQLEQSTYLPCWKPRRRERSGIWALPPTPRRLSGGRWNWIGWRPSCSPTTSWRARGRS